MLIRHHAGVYPVHFLSPNGLLADLPPASFLITDENVRVVLGDLIPPELASLTLTPGEGSKTLATYARCLEWLAATGASRRATVVALGGGVVGDLAGFVAASYMRGVKYLQIPTTLLAQVDSSVGGKVGVDLPNGKNMVGAFHAPVEVRIAVELLSLLPQRQFASGMAEVWKYGAIMDAELFEQLADVPLTPQSSGLADVVERCIELKAHVVEEDEFEITGRRAILNFGHTVAHALEILTGFGPLLHGEAVAIGMVVEARLGEQIGMTPAGTAETLTDVLTRQGLPTFHPMLEETDAMLAAMRRDKKAADGRLAFSLLTHIGGCKLVESVHEPAIRAVLSPI